jgi:endonuclease YncB( thermonuclease family)
MILPDPRCRRPLSPGDPSARGGRGTDCLYEACTTRPGALVPVLLAAIFGLGLAALPAPAAAADGAPAVCTEASRSDRKATCLEEGDMGIEKGLAWVLLDVDTPSIANPGCPAEKADGEAARARLIALMAPGYRILDSGRRDRSRRARVTIQLADGRDAGSVLIAEDLAQPWRSKGNVWCGW